MAVYGVFLLLLTSCNSNSKKNETIVIRKWFSAWRYMSDKVQKIDNNIEVDYVFFNDKYVYTTSRISAQNGDEIKIEDSKKKWYRNEYQDKIILPNGEMFVPTIAVFTVPSTIKNRLPFFVMPLNSFWDKNGLKSKNSTLENLTTAIFLHEFSHTQQLKTFGKKISEFEKNNKFKLI